MAGGIENHVSSTGNSCCNGEVTATAPGAIIDTTMMNGTNAAGNAIINNNNNNNNNGSESDDSSCSSSSSTSSAFFFEGVEKLMEVWFIRRDGKNMVGNKTCDLRNIPRQKIESLLNLVKCEVISFMSNETIDAYVLSESSLFVSKRRFILKTCGTTTPLQCLKPLMALVNKYAGFDDIEDIFYSRKNFKKPELQLLPHRNFEDEVRFLDKLFPNGAAYSLGSINRDCWYLYTINNLLAGIWENNNKIPKLVQQNNGKYEMLMDGIAEPDQTLEILMTDLDPKIMKIFTKEVCSTGTEATEKAGIDRIIPNMKINEHLFEPCGYSMNGIMKNGAYMTIHITPEPEFSYVSFETNVALLSYESLVEKVLDTFQPGQAVLTLFANQASIAHKVGQSEIGNLAVLKEKWFRLENQYCKLKNYDLTYALYAKFPS